MSNETDLVGTTNPEAEATRPRFVSEAEAFEKARVLARALAASPEFRAFEAAHGRLRADPGAGALLQRLQAAEQQVAMLQTWGGMATDALDGLARLRAEVADHPTPKTLFAAQDALLQLFKDAAGIITAEVGLDFGAACSPAGGCC